MIAARPCVLRFVSLTHTHTTLSLKGTGDRKGARAAGQAGNQHVDVHEKRTLRTQERGSQDDTLDTAERRRRTNTVRTTVYVQDPMDYFHTTSPIQCA